MSLYTNLTPPCVMDTAEHVLAGLANLCGEIHLRTVPTILSLCSLTYILLKGIVPTNPARFYASLVSTSLSTCVFY